MNRGVNLRPGAYRWFERSVSFLYQSVKSVAHTIQIPDDVVVHPPTCLGTLPSSDTVRTTEFTLFWNFSVILGYNLTLMVCKLLKLR